LVEMQASNATINRLRVGTICHVRIGGVIDETFPLTSATPDLNGLLIIDLGQVERISSFGVRRWIEFAGKLPASAISLYVVHAPPVIVDQLNMVEGFAGVARVLTVLAPYTCRTCGEDRLRLVDLQAEADVIAEGRAPAHSCPVCANPLEFADQPGEFFDYARRQQFGTVDPVVMRYLRATTPSAPTALATHLKIVQDDITYVTLASELRADLNVRRLASGLEGRVAFDFAHVSKVEPEAVAKLEQVLATAAQGAKEVVLCRVPPPVLNALARFSKPPAAKLGSLWLPCECRNCGHEHHQRTLASEYLAGLRANASPERVCPICGGSARLPAMPTLLPLLSRSALMDEPPEELEAIEPRALSQYLFGSTNNEPGGAKAGTGSGDIANAIGNTRLQIIRRLGQGGMAEVFLAKAVGVKGFEKFVVMKKILPQFAESAEFVEMLFAEARANARLTHPNVVQTFDVGMADGVAYITMEYVRGPDLKKLMNELRRKGVALPLEHALRIVAETAAGLHYAHSYVDPAGVPHPVVHRDVSPHNVLISLDGAVKLSDFGIAKVQGEDHTQAGVLKGKISYLSPEAASGRPLDARNDVFALGVMLFELLTGTLPFKRDHDAATLNAIVREPAPVPSQLKSSIPEDVSDLILRALVKDPARRTPSAAAMREEIEAVMAHHRLNSSPAAVAQFFKNTLGERLVEFGPVNTSPATGSYQTVSPGTGSKPVLATGTGSKPALATGTSSKSALSGSGSKPALATGSGSKPALATGGSGSKSALAPGTGARPAPATGTGSRPPLSQPAAPPPPPPPSQAYAAEVDIDAEFPDESTEHERTELYQASVASKGASPVMRSEPRTTNQRPPLQTSQSVPLMPPLEVEMPPARPAPAPRAPVAAAPPSPMTGNRPALSMAPPQVPPQAPPAAVAAQAAPLGGRGKLLLLGVAGLLVLAGVGVVGVKAASGSGIEVINLEQGESLYVNGIRVDPAKLVLADSESFVLSTTLQGSLHRVGKTGRKDIIDVRALPKASRPSPGSMGTMRVGEPAGCIVKVGETMQQGTSPLAVSIEAGKEVQVILSCGQTVQSQWVMAVPGQDVEFPVQPAR
jgi:serine/threonine protein kinase